MHSPYWMTKKDAPRICPRGASGFLYPTIAAHVVRDFEVLGIPAFLLAVVHLHGFDAVLHETAFSEDLQTDPSGCLLYMRQETAEARVLRVDLVVLWDVVSPGQYFEVNGDTRSSVR